MSHASNIKDEHQGQKRKRFLPRVTQYRKKITQTLKLLIVAALPMAATQSHAATEMYFIHNDHLATPQVVTNQSQTVVWEGNKKPFGETEETTSTIDQQARFPGQYFDEESGYSYNYFRDYDPMVGRFIQSDPIGILKDFSNPQLQVILRQNLLLIDKLSGLNHTYGYVAHNPLKFIDLFGLFRGCVEIAPNVYKCPDSGPPFNDGSASAFPPSTNDACVNKCIKAKISACISPGNASKPSTLDATLTAACVASAVITCSSQTCDQCDDTYK